MKLIFLDIDGVLITLKTCKHFGVVDPECVQQLNRITDVTGAKIVLSSCWRIGWTIHHIREKLKEWGVTGEVISKTPVDWKKERGEEIQQWLDEYYLDNSNIEPIESIVIIDDDRDMAHMLPYLVHTTFTWGLTEQCADLAINYLTNTTPQVVENSVKTVENSTKNVSGV